MVKKDDKAAELVEVSVANPPKTEAAPAPKEKKQVEVQRNAFSMGRFGGITSQVKSVNWKGAAGSVVGLFSVLTIPKLVGWSSGWKDIAATGLTTVVGSWLISKWDKSAGHAFAIVGIAVLGLKVVKMLLGQGTTLLGGVGGRVADEAFGALGGLGSDIGQDSDLFAGNSGGYDPLYVGAALETTYTGGL